MISAILFISFFIFLILGVPIGICLGLSSVCAILYSGTSLTIVATNMYSGISKFLLLAIPFFVLSGNIMAKAGISKRLIKFVDTCVGHKKGGIAIVCVIVACFFGAISGSGPATVAALGAVLIPAMVEQGGFSAPFSTALMATSSSIAIVIPPSIAFVVYASITGVSIADMFMAGIVPGLLMGVALVIVVMLEAKKHNIKPSREKASGKERWDAFKDAFWGFLMPIIILGGIYGGIFTPTEAAAVSVVYGLFVGMVIYREVSIRDMFDILVDSAKTTGGIMLIVASASLFSFVCTKFGIADAASNLLGSIAHNQFTFLLIVNIIFLIAGCFIDANSAMYIFIPIMLPVCKALGYDVVAFCVMATVGVNLFVAISIKIKKGLEVTLQEISRAVVPMIAACVAVLLIVTYIPITSTFLPKVLAKEGSYTGVQSSASSVETMEATSLTDTILNIIPDNPINSLASGTMLQVIVFALIVGVILAKMGERAETVANFFSQFNDIMMEMTMMIMALAPIGVFCLISRTFANIGFSAFIPLAKYMIGVLLALAIQCFGVYQILLKIFTGLNPIKFIKKFFPVMAFAFSTATSNATIPMSIDTLSKKVGVSKKISSFTIPLGATINMDGTSIMQGVAVVFAAQAFGIHLSPMDYVTVIGTATLASVGTAGVPSVGLVTLTMVFNSVGLPVEAIGLIMGIDRILDMTRTAVNITGDAVCTTIVAHQNNALDRKVFNESN